MFKNETKKMEKRLKDNFDGMKRRNEKLQDRYELLQEKYSDVKSENIHLKQSDNIGEIHRLQNDIEVPKNVHYICGVNKLFQPIYYFVLEIFIKNMDAHEEFIKKIGYNSTKFDKLLKNRTD